MDIQLWREMLAPYQLAIDELLVKFRHMKEQHEIQDMYSPIEFVDGRLKSIASILDKMQRKDVSMNDLQEKIEDIAGIRITCQFVEDIDRVVQLIRNRRDMKITLEKDYISNKKDSGYQSYHIIIQYTVETIHGQMTLPVEIQIRTMAMNFWATVEHSLQYKYKGSIPSHIQQKLSDASAAIDDIDHAMSEVRDEILDAQIYHIRKDNVVKSILNNIQNLFKVANRREVIKIQEEFYKVYETEDLTQLQHFAKQLDIISEGYHAQALE
ncbi:MAG: GTP pyrophosphokinase family protein [Eubacteriales bacterium]|nr:GTP pyrophosphokinase family protein [Eubacteriales bacterium]